MTSERRNAAAVLAMCSWVKGRIKTIEAYARDVADVTFPQEKTAAAVDGRVVAYTQRVTQSAKERFTILDREGFAEWVAARWPSEVEMTVRPSFLTILADIADRHDGVLIDDGGEVCPHVKRNDPTVYTMTKLTKEADEVLAPLLADLTLESLPHFIENEKGQR